MGVAPEGSPDPFVGLQTGRGLTIEPGVTPDGHPTDKSGRKAVRVGVLDEPQVPGRAAGEVPPLDFAGEQKFGVPVRIQQRDPMAVTGPAFGS